MDKPDQVMVDFIREVIRKEGAWIVEPAAQHDSVLNELLGRMRMLPARIDNPPGTNRYAFAERSSRGRWLFIWVPTD